VPVFTHILDLLIQKRNCAVTDDNILVVEDDPDGQELVGRMLRHHRIPSEVVGSAEDALAMLAQQNYRAVIIDLALPGMDGWTLLNQIHSSPGTAELPCVAMTAYHSPELAIEAVRAGFLAYFPKPLEATSFVRELQRILG
jgi:CheY-like chemotaxis protein